MTTQTNAIALLKEDHKRLKELFESFEKTEDSGKKEKIVGEALKILKVHSAIEEEIFYPTVREALKEEDEEILNEADEEHRVAKTLVKELETEDSSDDHFDAKFTVLAENVRHHIQEEEGELFKQAKETDIDFKQVGELMAARKRQLLSNEDILEQAVERSAVKPYQELVH